MRVMLLAAGLGERMQPLTRFVPKPVLPVLGRPMAVQILRRLATAGVRRAVVNLHHLPDRVSSLLGRAAELGLERVDFSDETDGILGTGGGIRKAAGLLRGARTILVHNADFLADIDVRGAVAAHRASGCLATLALAPYRPGYTVVEVDPSGRVVSFGGDRPLDPSRSGGRYLFTGFHVIEEAVLDRLPPHGPSDIVRDLYRQLAREGALGSWLHRGFWWEFGTPEAYLEGNLRLLGLDGESRARVAETDPVRELAGATVAVGAGADYHGGVALHGRVALGFASRVGEGARIEDSVVMPEAWVGPGSRLRRCVVGPASEIPAGFDGEDLLVLSDGSESPPPEGVGRRGGLLLRPLGATSDR